jgi:hypothetical protein
MSTRWCELDGVMDSSNCRSIVLLAACWHLQMFPVTKQQ